MAGKQARESRRARRAVIKGYSLVTKRDLRNVVGGSIDHLWEYAQSHKLRVRINSVDGTKEPPFHVGGPDLITVDIVDSIVIEAFAYNRKKVSL